MLDRKNKKEEEEEKGKEEAGIELKWRDRSNTTCKQDCQSIINQTTTKKQPKIKKFYNSIQHGGTDRSGEQTLLVFYF